MSSSYEYDILGYDTELVMRLQAAEVLMPLDI